MNVPCTDCAARSLAYDFRGADPAQTFVDGNLPVPHQHGRCREMVTDQTYSSMCEMSGGKVVVGIDNNNRHCTVDTVHPSVPALVAPRMFLDEVRPHARESVLKALEPGRLENAKELCRTLGGSEYHFDSDFCLAPPFHR